MNTQNYKNHKRIVIGYHRVGAAALLLSLAGAVAYLFISGPEERYPAILILLNTVVLAIVAYYARIFPLKAQDRAIRAEENLRHYVLTGKPLPSGLKIAKITALRFASNEEFVELAARAEQQKLRSASIKQAIKNWREDHHRV